MSGPAERKAFGAFAYFPDGPLPTAKFIIHSRLAARAACSNGFPSMTLIVFLGLLPALLGLSGEPRQPAQGVRRVVIEDEVVISVRIRPPVRQKFEWVEAKGPKCVHTQRLAGAMWSGPSSIDFLLRDRTRIRAIMDNECPALDFYGGLYLQPDDDRICAKRETIRNRVGGSCRIERFKILTPQLKQVRR